MTIWFEVSVKYLKVNEDGKQKNVSEKYLVDAVSWTEAEARAFEVLGDELGGEFAVTNISKTNITEIVPNENGDNWYKCKVSFVMLDEDSGKEKKVNNYFLVQANSVEEAKQGINESLKEMLAPFDVPSISQTKIIDVFPNFTIDQEEDVPVNLRPVDE